VWTKRTSYPCDVRSESLDVALFLRPVREAREDVFCVELVQGLDCQAGNGLGKKPGIWDWK